MAEDRAVLGLLLLVGGSSLLWGLYQISSVSSRSPSGAFNTILGLLVLLVAVAYVFPRVLPEQTRRPAPGPHGAEGEAAEAPIDDSPPAGWTTLVAAKYPPRPSPARPPLAAKSRPSRASARPTAATPPARPVPRAGPRTPPPRPEVEAEIAEILRDLPGPIDESAGSATPDEMVRRLDELIRDLSDDEPGARSSRVL